MSDDNVVNLGDAAVIRRLKAKPMSYAVRLTHLVVAGEWVLGVKVEDVYAMDAETRACIIYDLRQAADMIEANDQWEAAP